MSQTYIITRIRDMTSRQQAEAALRELEKKANNKGNASPSEGSDSFKQ